MILKRYIALALLLIVSGAKLTAAQAGGSLLKGQNVGWGDYQVEVVRYVPQSDEYVVKVLNRDLKNQTLTISAHELSKPAPQLLKVALKGGDRAQWGDYQVEIQRFIPGTQEYSFKVMTGDLKNQVMTAKANQLSNLAAQAQKPAAGAGPAKAPLADLVVGDLIKWGDYQGKITNVDKRLNNYSFQITTGDLKNSFITTSRAELSKIGHEPAVAQYAAPIAGRRPSIAPGARRPSIVQVKPELAVGTTAIWKDQNANVLITNYEAQTGLYAFRILQGPLKGRVASALADQLIALEEEKKEAAQAQAFRVPEVALVENVNTRYGTRMEDRHIMLPKEGFFGVFDGHGGQSVAQYIVASDKYKPNRLVKFFNDEKAKGRSDGEALIQALDLIEENIWRLQDLPNDFGIPVYARDASGKYVPTAVMEKFGQPGATAIVAKLDGNKLIVANIGDSRAVLIRNNKIIKYTNDHSIEGEEEKRIIAAGGQITHGFRDVPRVAGLAMSRSLGDVGVKLEAGEGSKDKGQSIISPKPDMYEWNIQSEDVLLLASDGIWDAMDNPAGVGRGHSTPNIVLQKELDNKQINLSDLNFALGRIAKRAIDLGSDDNITILGVRFK